VFGHEGGPTFCTRFKIVQVVMDVGCGTGILSAGAKRVRYETLIVKHLASLYPLDHAAVLLC
jgi:16S rRNA G1207 methylase RsmC